MLHCFGLDSSQMSQSTPLCSLQSSLSGHHAKISFVDPYPQPLPGVARGDQPISPYALLISSKLIAPASTLTFCIAPSSALTLLLNLTVSIFPFGRPSRASLI